MAVISLVDYLRIWQKHFDPRIYKSFLERVWVYCHGNKPAVLIGLTVLTLAALDGIMVRSSILDAGPTLRFVSGIYACTAGVLFFTFRKPASLLVLRKVLRVAVAVEGSADDVTKESLRRSGTRFRSWLRAAEGYSGFVFVSVMVPALLSGQPANPSWPAPTSTEGRWSLLTLHFFSTIFLPAGFFPLFAFIGTVQGACCALYRALGKRLERAQGYQEVRDVVELLSWLNEASNLIVALFYNVYIHVMLPTLIMPLIGAYEIVNGQVDPFLFAVAPLNIVVFVPLCFTGQDMADVSSSLSESAYAGRWLEEDVKTKRLRLHVMQRASRPVQPASRQLGPVNLALCQGAFRSWFSYLNVLLNTTNRNK